MIDASFGLKTWIYLCLIMGVFMFLGLITIMPSMVGELILWELPVIEMKIVKKTTIFIVGIVLILCCSGDKKMNESESFEKAK